MRKHVYSSESHPTVSLTPLIDTVLVLLVIFMVTTPVMRNSLKVDLPDGTSKEGVPLTDDIVVTIDKKGNFFVDDASVTEEKLVAYVRGKMPLSQRRLVVLDVDREITAAVFVTIIDKLKSEAGVEYVIVETRPQSSG
jgi:biopolymer transport protein ExbD